MRKWEKDGEDGVTLSKIQLFDNWRAGLGEEKTNLTRREKCVEAIGLAYLEKLSSFVKPELGNSPFIRNEDLSVKSKVLGTRSKRTPHLVFGRT
jgi:hypothetical protein